MLSHAHTVRPGFVLPRHAAALARVLLGRKAPSTTAEPLKR